MILFSENRQFPLFKCFYGPWTQYSNINNSNNYLYFYFIFLGIFGYIYIFGSPPLTLKSVLPTMHMRTPGNGRGGLVTIQTDFEEILKKARSQSGQK